MKKSALKFAQTLGIASIILIATASQAEDLSLCKQGWAATQGKNFDRAIALFDDCVKTGNLSQSSLAQTYRNYAITYMRMALPEKAIEYESKALQMQPRDAWNDYVNRGNALSDAGRFDEALADYDRAGALKPDLADVNYNRGIVYERQQELAKAKAEFIEAYRKGLRSQQLRERLMAHTIMKEADAAAQESDPIGKFIADMVRMHEGKTVCIGNGISVQDVRANVAAFLRLTGEQAPVTSRTLAIGMWRLYPCPFSPFGAELRLATAKDVEGVWLFPESSQKLRFPPQASRQSPAGPVPVRCDSVGYYDGGELRHAVIAGQATCPFAKASDLDVARMNPKVVTWSLVRPGRIGVTRTDVADHIEEWDVFSVEKPFTFDGVDFSPGDLVAYIRREKGNDVGAATQFRHLKRLP